MRVLLASLPSLSLLALLCGCEAKTAPAPTAAAPSPPPLATIAPPPAPPPVAQPAPMSEPPTTAQPMPQPEATPMAPVETETVKAQVGVGQKGRSLDEYEGVVVTPVKSLFAVRERAVFEIQIPQALVLFNATEGRFPKSHEEFMEKVVMANQLQLPELPPNHRYKYDPERNELMVERPKQAPAPEPGN